MGAKETLKKVLKGVEGFTGGKELAQGAYGLGKSILTGKPYSGPTGEQITRDNLDVLTTILSGTGVGAGIEGISLLSKAAKMNKVKSAVQKAKRAALASEGLFNGVMAGSNIASKAAIVTGLEPDSMKIKIKRDPINRITGKPFSPQI